MKLVCTILSLASYAFFSTPMAVHGKPHGIKEPVSRFASHNSISETPTVTVAVASSPREENNQSWLRRLLKKGRSPSSLSSSKFSAKELGSAGCKDHCLSACEESGGVAAGDLIVPPASIDSWKETKDVYCCDGGASFLKVAYQAGNGQAGLLTFDADIAAKNSTCDKIYDQTFNIAKKSGGSTFSPTGFEIRFISCVDACVLEPLSGVPCSDSFDTIVVESGTEVCFAAIDPTTHTILFDQKMGTNVYPFFIPYGDEDPGTLAGVIHTSCSKPVVPPFAAIFYDACGNFDEGHLLINLENYDGITPYLAFLDGISTGYFKSAMSAASDEDESSYQQEFDITFGNCGCTCESFSPALPTPAPTSMAPSGGSGNPGPGFVPPQKCPSTCSEEILQNCFFSDIAGSELAGKACDINANLPDNLAEEGEESGDDGRRRLRMIDYHFARIEAIEKILATLE
ncbi:hypothetical protein IV203_001913 [Nitzschia inconspicua]|uniref:Uncharacterized protein n=1 Tax=Nitzschia inconspicua TaxID=303405 RepID=A0A9K3L951_9STRA|nr:hypothetical protein IV203_001913 [Nitzschia inconspicua]